MVKKKVPVVSVVGWSKSGKTSFLERLIQAAKKRKMRVVAVKHTHHKIEEGKKDTARLREAGADPVLLVSKDLFILTKKIGDDFEIEKILEDLAIDADIVFAEGFKKSRWPKIEVYSERGEPLFKKDPNIVALISEKPVISELPIFDPKNPEEVLEFIIRRFSSVP